MKKRFLSILLTVCMMMSLSLGFTLPARADYSPTIYMTLDGQPMSPTAIADSYTTLSAHDDTWKKFFEFKESTPGIFTLSSIPDGTYTLSVGNTGGDINLNDALTNNHFLVDQTPFTISNTTTYPLTLAFYSVSYKPGTYAENRNVGWTRIAAKDRGQHIWNVLSFEYPYVRDGYKQIGWSTDEDGTSKTYDKDSVLYPTAAVVLYPAWAALETLTINSGDGGTITVEDSAGTAISSGDAVVAGDTVNITTKPDAGYIVDTVKYNDGSDHTLTGSNGAYSFDMPSAATSISVTYKAFSYTVTVQKDGKAWTDVTNDKVVLSTSASGAATNQKTGDVSNGVITFGGLDATTTYYVWAKNNAGTYVKTGSVLFSSQSATVNYYDVTLTKGTGIESVIGGGTYLSGENATISATLTAGYTFEQWSDNDTTMTNRSIPVNTETNLIASASLTPAIKPTITDVTGASLTYGYTSGSVSVTATAADGHTITGYQWYSNSTNSNSGGNSITGATSASYALSTGKAIGATEYYYCVVTSKRTDNSQTTTATSDVATVTVGKADGSGSVSMDDWTYGGTAKTPTPASATNGIDHVTYIYEGTDSTSYTPSTTPPTNAGTYQVTAIFAATDSYKEYTATATFTIAPQPVTEPTADTASFVYTGSEQTYTLTENVLYTITGNKLTNAGEQMVIVALKDKANYVWATSNKTTDLTFTFTIAKAPVSFAVSGNTHDYDAAPHSAIVTQTASETPSVVGCFTVAYQKDTELATANETNVGAYKIIVTLTDNNFKFEGKDDTVRSLTLTDKLTINAVAYPGTDTIPLPTAGGLTYGARLSDSTLTGGDTGCTYAWKTGTTIPIVMNTGYAVVCTPQDTNYAPFDKTVSITVSKATPTLTLPTAGTITYGQKLSDSDLTGGAASATYNGAANTNVPGAYRWSAETTSPQVSDSNFTQYEVTFTPTDTANYGTATGKITLIVNPKPVTLTWDYTAPFTYDGTAKTVTATVSNKVDEGDTFNLTFSDNSKTSAGSYAAEVTALGNDNYSLTDAANVSKDWVITKAPISFAVSDNSYTYDAASHTVTVTQTASESPVIATGKYAVTYKHKLPAEDSGTPDKTDAGVYDVIVTLSDDNFCFADESDAATRSHKVGELTIVKSTVTALWKNTTTVYDGTEKSPIFELVGLKAVDTGVTAQLTESKINAETYTVTAKLIGANSGNYALTNPTETFIIQKAPVSFTLSGNSVKKGKSVNIIATPSVNGISSTLTYWQSGKQVAAPTETGSYDVYAEITNPNYRHAGGTDGTAQKIGVLTIYESDTPATYTVSFDANGGTGRTASMDAAQAGTVRILPESGFTSNGKIFAGWQYGSKIYQPGECFTQPSSNVTLKALWNDKVYSIGGTVQEGDPVSNAANVVVTLMLGSQQIGQTVTGADGTYSFADVVPGVYNLVANKDGVTQTVMVTIKDKAVTDRTITMPAGKLSSVVEVKAGSPAIVVGNLEKAFTQQDKTDAASKTVELKLTAQAKAADSANNAQQEIEKMAGSVDLFLDSSLTKTVNGIPSPLDSSPVLLTAVITLPAELQGKDSYTVYRCHGTEVQALTTTANTDGEKIEVNMDRTMLTVYTKNFSAYAIKGVTYSNDGVSSYKLTYSSGGASSYKLTFEVNGGIAITALSKTSDATVDLSAYTPVREGYTFAGWYSDAKLTTAITSVKLTANTTVYAKWAEKGAMPFTDVPADSYYYDAALWALNKGITGGTTATTFNPNGICTRAQMVTFLWRAMGSPEPTAMSCPFTDVIEDTYYYKAVLWATEKSITKGTTDITFSPNMTVTRSQAMAFLWRTACNPAADTTNPFADVETDAYYADAVLWAVKEGITSGTSTITFSPADGCSRAQIVTFLYRYLAK